MNGPVIDLVYVEGCPNLDATRANLRAALGTTGAGWREWDAGSAQTPAEFRRFGSPTILVNGRDVTERVLRIDGASCRTDEPPSAAMIREAVSGAPGVQVVRQEPFAAVVDSDANEPGRRRRSATTSVGPLPRSTR